MSSGYVGLEIYISIINDFDGLIFINFAIEQNKIKMDTFSVCVTFISVLLGIAYPILIQITGNDKYSSEKILELFENNWRRQVFMPNLVFSLVFVGIYLLRLPPIFTFQNETLNHIFENSALLILFISTITLIISFFLIINLVTIFYRTSALIKFLSDKGDAVINKSDFSSFDGLADLLYWSIQHQDSNASKQLSDYFYNIFRSYREKFATDEPLIYPDRFYWLVYNATEKIVGLEKNTLVFLEIRTVGGTWLLGEFDVPKISENTYSWLWANVALSLNSNRGDLLITFWGRAHQFFAYNLDYITPDYDYQDDDITYKNQAAIDKRNEERETFLEFQFALGGLLLYKNRPDLVKRIFYYTTSTPPDYVLLPKNMTLIFNMFFKFFDPYERHFPWITHKYNFPGLEGLNADRTIKDWICQYIAILFIRQMNLNSHYSNWDPTEVPRTPTTLAEKRFWAENIKYFRPILEKAFEENKQLLQELKYNMEKDSYIKKFDSIEKVIVDVFNQGQVDVVPEIDKIQQFFESSKQILDKTFKKFNRLDNKKAKPEGIEYDVYNIQGLVNVTNKGTFADDGVDHLNFDTFLAESASSNYGDRFFQIFNAVATKKYIFDQENIFKAIDKLKLNASDHVLLAFGFININYYIENLKIAGLTNSNYNGVQILFFPGRIYGISNSIFAVAKANLPWLEYKDFDGKTQTLYELEPILPVYKIYAGVSDLHTNKHLRDQIIKEGNADDKDLHKSVWQGIMFVTIARFLKSRDIVQLLIRNDFENQRKLNKVDDVSELE